MKIEIERRGPDNYLATWEEASIGSSGDSCGEALLNLWDEICTTYELLESLRDDQLGPIPRQQLFLLKHELGPYSLLNVGIGGGDQKGTPAEDNQLGPYPKGD